MSRDAAEQFYNAYGYGSNPVLMVDPDGNFITWSFGRGGFSIGINIFGLGAGINVGWRGGLSLGGYGEVGFRVGGTGFGLNGGTVSQSLDYNFKYGDLSTTTTESLGASFGVFNASASTSQRYSLTNDSWSYSWGVGAGVGVGDGEGNTFGANFGYGGDFRGHDDWNIGLGGSLDKEGHYRRNPKNGDVDVADLFNDDGRLKENWISLNKLSGKLCHTHGYDPNDIYKYVNTKTGQEVVIHISGKTGRMTILTGANDPVNMGTYNYYVPKNLLSSSAHFGVDMLPYYFFGNAPGDNTGFISKVTELDISIRPIRY